MKKERLEERFLQRYRMPAFLQWEQPPVQIKRGTLLVWMPWQLEIPAAVHAVHQAMVPAEEENTLEEFAWAFGDDAVEEMEKKKYTRSWNRFTNFRIWKDLQT